MEVKSGRRLKRLFFVMFLFICGSVGTTAFAQDKEGLITEGKSFEKILIGKTTLDEAAAIYGGDYELMNHKEYSYEMIYVFQGLSFFACQADPKKEIFAVEIRTPYRARTGKGIVLGESTLGDVFDVYGSRGARVYSDSDQKGVYFFVEDDNDPDSAYKPAFYEEDSTEMMLHKQKVIKRIELVEKSGMRQCDDKFPQKQNR